MSYELVLSWALVVIIGNALPGPDFMFITSMSLRKRSYGILGGLGLETGVICHSLIACFGSIVLYKLYAPLFTVIQLIGSLYIAWIGWSVFYSTLKTWREFKNKQAAGEDLNISAMKGNDLSFWHVYSRGFICNILNPKCFIFMATVLPQFVDQHAAFPMGWQLFILCVLNIILGLIHWTLLSVLVDFLATKFASFSFRLKLELVSGILLILIGVILFLYNIVPIIVHWIEHMHH